MVIFLTDINEKWQAKQTCRTTIDGLVCLYRTANPGGVGVVLAGTITLHGVGLEAGGLLGTGRNEASARSSVNKSLGWWANCVAATTTTAGHHHVPTGSRKSGGDGRKGTFAGPLHELGHAGACLGAGFTYATNNSSGCVGTDGVRQRRSGRQEIFAGILVVGWTFLGRAVQRGDHTGGRGRNDGNGLGLSSGHQGWRWDRGENPVAIPGTPVTRAPESGVGNHSSIHENGLHEHACPRCKSEGQNPSTRISS